MLKIDEEKPEIIIEKEPKITKKVAALELLKVLRPKRLLTVVAIIAFIVLGTINGVNKSGGIITLILGVLYGYFAFRDNNRIAELENKYKLHEKMIELEA